MGLLLILESSLSLSRAALHATQLRPFISDSFRLEIQSPKRSKEANEEERRGQREQGLRSEAKGPLTIDCGGGTSDARVVRWRHRSGLSTRRRGGAADPPPAAPPPPRLRSRSRPRPRAGSPSSSSSTASATSRTGPSSRPPRRRAGDPGPGGAATRRLYNNGYDDENGNYIIRVGDLVNGRYQIALKHQSNSALLGTQRKRDLHHP